MTMPCLLRAQRSLTGPAQAEPLPHTGHSAGPSARLSPGPWPWSRYHRARCCVTNKTLDLQQTEGCVGSTSVPGVSRKTKTKTIQGPRCSSWELLAAAAQGLDADTHCPPGGTQAPRAARRLRAGLGVLALLSVHGLRTAPQTPARLRNVSPSERCVTGTLAGPGRRPGAQLRSRKDSPSVRAARGLLSGLFVVQKNVTLAVMTPQGCS